MLETYNSDQAIHFNDHAERFDFWHFIDIFKRRIFYFALPFIVIVIMGTAITKAQRPIYRAEAEILVESPDIAPDLAHFTIKVQAEERFEVFKQRIIAGSNLLALVDKYDLFPTERRTMSEFQILALMRSRMQLKLLPLQTPANGSAIAFGLTFDYEIPDLALKVANDLLTEILTEDASRRTGSATETTALLEKEVQRLQKEHDAIVAQIVTSKQAPAAESQAVSEQLRTQIKTLADAEADLVQKSAIYSDEHPLVKSLQKKVAALKRLVAKAPHASMDEKDSQLTKDSQLSIDRDVLKQREFSIEKSLEDANSKLASARLGESIERSQQAEHLRVIQSPELPHKPIGPKKPQWLGITFALACMIGAGAVFAAEKLDGSIRASRELTGVFDRHLIIAIPYLYTPGEKQRNRWRFFLLSACFVVVLVAGVAGAIFTRMPDVLVDFDQRILTMLH